MEAKLSCIVVDVVVDGQNSKIWLFHKNQISSRGSILALFSHEDTADAYFH